MSIVAADLVLYAAASRPDDDADTCGGAIDPDMRLVMTQLAANDTLQAKSSNAADTTQTLTVKGRNAAGESVTCTADLDGETPVALDPNEIFYVVESAVLDADCAGNITLERVTGGDDVGVIPAGERGFTQLFIGADSQASEVVRYEKGFYKNCHATLTLTAAEITLTDDPSDTIEVGKSATKDDTATVTNRLTDPGVTFVDDDVAIAVVGGVLAAGEAQGIWFKQTLGAAAAPVKSYGALDLDGQST